MIDYKLVLILVLSIVLVFMYNRIEDLRDDVNILKKKIDDKKIIDDRNLLNNKKTSDELLNLFHDKNSILNDTIGGKNTNPKNCDNNQKCDMPVLSKNQNLEETYVIEKKDNTSSYKATESSEDIDINYEHSSSNEDKKDEFIVFSNEKEKNINTEIIDVSNIIDNIDTNNILMESFASTLLAKTFNPDLDIIQDSSNSDDRINIDQLNESEKSECKEHDNENLMKEFENIELVECNGVVQIQKKISIDTSEEDCEEDNVSDLLDGDISTSEFQKINLNSITKYRLDDLQKLAEKYSITITKNNGKNKTKKELYNELTIYKQN